MVLDKNSHYGCLAGGSKHAYAYSGGVAGTRDWPENAVKTFNLSKYCFRLAAIIALAIGLTLGGCARKSEKTAGSRGAGSSATKKQLLHSTGSDTMVSLAQEWSEAFRKVNPDVFIEVSGGGSGAGIGILAKGTVDMVNSSRKMKPAEAELIWKNTGKLPKEFVVGYDALAIYVHKDNPLNEITIGQLAAIYGEGGNVTNWSQLGVKVPGCGDNRILRASRQPSSGTYEFLRENVLGNKDFKPAFRSVIDSKEMVELVASSPCAIGYSGMGYATPNVKILKVANGQGQPAYAPGLETIRNKTYGLTRSLQIYTVGEPDGVLKQFLLWAMSDPGQHIVESNSFLPLPPASRTK